MRQRFGFSFGNKWRCFSDHNIKPLLSTTNSYKNKLRILGIESTFDETGLALVDAGINEVGLWHANSFTEFQSSQWKQLSTFGGINPKFAADEHCRQLPLLLHKLADKTLKQKQQDDIKTNNKSMQMEDHVNIIRRLKLDAIAVASGPGHALCLKHGVEFAVQLAREAQLPLLKVNHCEAHATVASMVYPPLAKTPFINILCTGGHTEIWAVHGVGKYVIIGRTEDDSIGEALDKTARLLQLERNPRESFGAALERHARDGDPTYHTFTIPMLRVRNASFSFSGLKSSVARLWYSTPLLERQTLSWKCNIAASFEKACLSHLELRLGRALLWARDNKFDSRIVVFSGGVSRNLKFRAGLSRVARQFNFKLAVLPTRLCTDNATMIAWLGLLRFVNGQRDAYEHSWQTSWPVGRLLEDSKFAKISNRVVRKFRRKDNAATISSSLMS